jgi:hypothetical protein
MNRAHLVNAKSPDRVPSERLRSLSEGYRVATDILIGIADRGCSDELYDYVWGVCQREADLCSGTVAEARA